MRQRRLEPRSVNPQAPMAFEQPADGCSRNPQSLANLPYSPAFLVKLSKPVPIHHKPWPAADAPGAAGLRSARSRTDSTIMRSGTRTLSTAGKLNSRPKTYAHHQTLILAARYRQRGVAALAGMCPPLRRGAL
jgi:hypothetical protein